MLSEINQLPTQGAAGVEKIHVRIQSSLWYTHVHLDRVPAVREPHFLVPFFRASLHKGSDYRAFSALND